MQTFPDSNQSSNIKFTDWFPKNAKTILWIGAHPDDEVYVAPLLKVMCLDMKLSCHLLVMTDGGKGHCGLDGGCHPSVSAVRDLEMKETAKFYNAILEKPNFEDSPAGSPEGVLEAWNKSIGGGETLITSLSNYIKRINPDLIFTFDPRHGSSCHLDHRALGLVVTEVVNRVKGDLSTLYYPEAVWATGKASPTQAWAGNEITMSQDQKVVIIHSADSWWALPKNLQLHPSQFSSQKNDYIDAFSFAPDEFRISPILQATHLSMTDPYYQNLCPFNDKYWPGRYPK